MMIMVIVRATKGLLRSITIATGYPSRIAITEVVRLMRSVFQNTRAYRSTVKKCVLISRTASRGLR